VTLPIPDLAGDSKRVTRPESTGLLIMDAGFIYIVSVSLGVNFIYLENKQSKLVATGKFSTE
jgi:hypothetical protein